MANGVLSYSERGSRMTFQTARGLASVDLGRISIDEAQKKAWLKKLTLLINGRIYSQQHRPAN